MWHSYFGSLLKYDIILQEITIIITKKRSFLLSLSQIIKILFSWFQVNVLFYRNHPVKSVRMHLPGPLHGVKFSTIFWSIFNFSNQSSTCSSVHEASGGNSIATHRGVTTCSTTIFMPIPFLKLAVCIPRLDDWRLDELFLLLLTLGTFCFRIIAKLRSTSEHAMLNSSLQKSTQVLAPNNKPSQPSGL